MSYTNVFVSDRKQRPFAIVEHFSLSSHVTARFEAQFHLETCRVNDCYVLGHNRHEEFNQNKFFIKTCINVKLGSC